MNKYSVESKLKLKGKAYWLTSKEIEIIVEDITNSLAEHGNDDERVDLVEYLLKVRDKINN